MSRRARIVLVSLTVASLPWLGMLQALPHDHADTTIPQERITCSASGATSHEIHLHEAGHPLSYHQCLACLSGATHAAAPSSLMQSGAESSAPITAEGPCDARSRGSASLPLLRGPPIAV